MAAEITIKEIPDECWAMIFNHLEHEYDWESVSLVCKRFLSLTNSFRTCLKVSSPSIKLLSKLLQRFSNLTKLYLHNFPGDLKKAIQVVARSELCLEELDLSANESLPTVDLEELGSKMKNLKVLNCSGSELTDSDLVKIANSFPQIEELHIRNSCFPYQGDDRIIAVTDEGIGYLSSKLKSLRKIDISGNQCISDRSPISLSSCTSLEHITVGYSDGLTEDGISFFIENSLHLNSLVLKAHLNIRSFGNKGSTNFCKNLQILKFFSVKISDEFLYSVAEAQIPLTELIFAFCKGYTFNGISKLLQAYQSLTSLVLLGAEFLTNENIEYLSAFLHNLTSICLNFCPKLSDSAFVTLTQRCPLLTNLEMGNTSLGREDYNYKGLKKNFATEHLNLSSNNYLNSSCLEKLLNICPKVKKLNLYNCFQHSELDIPCIIDSGKELVYLLLNGCRLLNFSREDMEISMLETLVAKYSGISDETLTKLGRFCPRLAHLDLEDCNNLTAEGVKEVVKSCIRLRFLCLSECSNVDVDIIPWLVANCSSLKQLVSPSSSYPEEGDQKHFLQQGCYVRQGATYEC